MKCPKCNASVPRSDLEFLIGICGNCNYRIWKKRIPGNLHAQSLVVAGLIFLLVLATNLVSRPDMSSIGDGIENVESCYGFPFLVSRPGLAIDYASVFTNVGCAFLVALLGWLMVLGFFRHAWYQYHFATYTDDEEEAYRKLKPQSEAAQKTSEWDIVVAQLVDELREIESDVVMPEINQLKMMATGTKLVFWAGCLTTIYITGSLVLSTLCK